MGGPNAIQDPAMVADKLAEMMCTLDPSLNGAYTRLQLEYDALVIMQTPTTFPRTPMHIPLPGFPQREVNAVGSSPVANSCVSQLPNSTI